LLATSTYCNKEGAQSFTSSQLEKIISIASQTKTQYLALSLFSHCTRTLGPFNSNQFFESIPSLEMLSLETGDLWEEDQLLLEIHKRDQMPIKFRRYFACGSDPLKNKLEFIKECRSGKRRINGISFCYCGEINGIRYDRKNKELMDEFGYLDTLKDSKLVMIPFHTQAKRWEIKLKKKYLSLNNKIVISYWNKMKRAESRNPWEVFINGKDASSRIIEIYDPILNPQNIRIALIKTSNSRI
jgi:hypothetical protein